MKFLFTPVGSQVTVYAVAPLATAVRNAGHEVLLAANEPLMEFAAATQLPAVSIMPEPTRHFVMNGPAKHAAQGPEDLREEMLGTGRGFARMATAALGPLLDLADDWPPDLVVGGSMSYAAGLLATRLKVPYVRHAEYLGVPTQDVDPGAEEGLRSELRHLGLAGLPDPALFVEACPPSLRSPHAPDGRAMRWIPSNPQRRLERWMYTRPEGRRRVLITSGGHFRMLSAVALRHLTAELAAEGAEVLVAAPGKAAEEFRAELGEGVRVGWMPLDAVAPTCDLVVNHGGATTAMTALAAGAPQLIYPPNTHTKAIAEALTGYGAALTVPPGRYGPDEEVAAAFAAGCREILSGPRYSERARALAAENAALPAPAEMVRTMEALAAA
ncbi:nucleotide disphospho-sugar-binding domain-containing protein [Actinomadura sp. 6K520]|uniref:nucleotide disphospho-sugar-binding domain-containing protein n=1 Tax=Actinomadura sp. 6K520 TaxID=2530364 RepID=UPI00104BF282|nr:nucleotide disphospho-sugar-binding domain-containing protein [Actinomadura sp. 6K520]TDE23854.1 glycosyltransferase [Actinomadura sp. 6K520]